MRQWLSRLDRYAPHIAAALLVGTCVEMLWRGWVLPAAVVFVVAGSLVLLVYLPDRMR